MRTTVIIDKAGRIVIPKKIRDDLCVQAGDSLALEPEGESVSLRPLHASTRLQKERGIWVFHGGEPFSLDAANRLIDQARVQRDSHSSGARHR